MSIFWLSFSCCSCIKSATVLWGRIDVVEDPQKVSKKEIKYYRTDSDQRLYDAVIVTGNPQDQVDLHQVTVGCKYDVSIDEFKELSEHFGKRMFRFFMIRVAVMKKDVDAFKGKRMSWVVKNSCMDFNGFPTSVEFYECMFDFEEMRAAYLKDFVLKRFRTKTKIIVTNFINKLSAFMQKLSEFVQMIALLSQGKVNMG
jgi:hypothetical protein